VTTDNHQRILRREGTISLQEHWEALEAANEKFMAERDRRYTEVSQEREKALKIKEEADKAALGLAREIQSYKDEKANQLREQISSERGSMATKEDLTSLSREIAATIQPLSAYVAGMAGVKQQSSNQMESSRTTISILVVTLAGLAVVISIVVPIFLHGLK
jgi:hypothetical protein